MSDWFYGTTLSDVRYCVEGWAAYEGGSLPASELPAKVVLHFPACKGGDVVEGYGIYNYLRGLAAKGVQIEARVEGLCASIAVLVALAADTVLMAEAALWMVHKPSCDGYGVDADQLRAQADLLDKIQAQIVGRYVARTGMDAATANDLINKESWLNADECLALGFITGKLQEAPLEVPTGADAVLNYFPTTKPVQNMALTPADETRLIDKFINAAKSLFAPKNEEQTETPLPTNTSTTIEVTDGDPMYVDTSDDGIADIDLGDAVYSDSGLTMAYPDGDYQLADGRDCTITSGTVASLADANADDSAATDLAAQNTALAAELEVLKAENALKERKITGLTNKLKKVVPGSAGAPTKPGEAQNLADKNAGDKAVARSAERSVFLGNIK